MSVAEYMSNTKIPVMSNIYFSNSVIANKKAVMPQSVKVKFDKDNRLNKFHIVDVSPKRFVSDTYKPSQRNLNNSAINSPIMMTSGVSPKDKAKELQKTQKILSLFREKSDYILANQGPSVLPLSGQAGSPIKFADRSNSLNLNNQLQHAEAAVDFMRFKATQFKETLPVRQSRQSFDLNASPKYKTLERKDSYTDAPIVRQTLINTGSNWNMGSSYKPSVNHFTSTITHSRALLNLATHDEKCKALTTMPEQIFSSTQISVPAEQMNNSFTNYEAYKKDLSPSASKSDYRQFLTTMQNQKSSYDSNISNALEVHKRIIQFKAKEQGLRNRALQINPEHSSISKNAQSAIQLKNQLETEAILNSCVKSIYEMPNYTRAPHQHTAITNYNHDLASRRVFALDGKMQLLRNNIRN